MAESFCAIRYDESMAYPASAPFDPDESYLELPFLPVSVEINRVYRQVRQLFIDLGMDAEHIDTQEWSPLSDLVSPGNTVVIKPNLITNTSDASIQNCTTTHPSVLRPIADYCWKAMKGEGRIVIGDAAGDGADFELLTTRIGLKSMVEELKKCGMNISLEDFRATKTVGRNGITIGDQKIVFDVPRYRIVNLGGNSEFACEKYRNVFLYGGGYDILETTRHHSGNVQEYCVSRTVLTADVVISVPKLKTHRKAGFTCCLKNLVGINVDKNYLPHFIPGSVSTGGDEMPAVEKKYFIPVSSYNWFRRNIMGKTWKMIGRPAVWFLGMLWQRDRLAGGDAVLPEKNKTDTSGVDLSKWLHEKLSGQPIDGGCWAGNETIAHMILDLNRIFLCCDANGDLREKSGRKVFYIVDGVTLGMGNGPLEPTPLDAHVLAAGGNGFQLDTGILRLLNIDPACIPLYLMAESRSWLTGDDAAVLLNGKLTEENDALPFEITPPTYWEYKKLR